MTLKIRNIHNLTDQFVNKALQKKVDEKARREAKAKFEQITTQIQTIHDSPFLHNKKIQKSLFRLLSRLQGYYSILLDLPEAYEDSPEDAIYAIISLGSVNNKIENELNILLDISKKQLNQKIDSMQNIVTNNKKIQL